MTDLHAYRASDELAAALREFKAADSEFCQRVSAFDEAHPGNELMWDRTGFTADRKAVGFRDAADELPNGLSRAKTRIELRPKKTKAGQEWQAVLDGMNERPRSEPVLASFGVPTNVWRGNAIAPTYFVDAGDAGVILFNAAGDVGSDTGGFHKADGDPLRHLTPIPLSEFYAIKERLEEKAA